MNLIGGEIYSNEEAMKLVDSLYERTVSTRSRGYIDSETVISACEQLISEIDRDLFIEMLSKQGMSVKKAERELDEALQIMSPEMLRKRVKEELGPTEFKLAGPEKKDAEVSQMRVGKVLEDPERDTVRIERRPLGVLFHISAGNLDVLPAYSVLEGLLAGNINILKLPGAVDDLSVNLLQRMTQFEPALKDYIYVFDFPSTDTLMMQKMAEVADAVVVWGGTEAVRAVRNLAGVDTRIIEWGHKVSFAYVTEDVTDAQLDGIAFNICDAQGLLCSSCQGIYVDTGSMDKLEQIAGRLLKCMTLYRDELTADLNIRARKSVELYTEEIEASVSQDKKIIRDGRCSIIIKPDSELEVSYGFGNVWMKRLPRKSIVSSLAKYKRFLQTAALCTGEKDRIELENLLLAAGIDRVTTGRGMSEMMPGEPHDGRWPLREYSKLVMCRD